MNDFDTDVLIKKLAERVKALGLKKPVVIGIHTGGVWVAEQLHKLLGIDSMLGMIDISFYRDDFSRVGLNPQVKASDLPHSIEDREILLVDDVLQTGRTIRAALNEIFSYGRPARVALAVLIDRSGRELPIQADAIGEILRLKPNQQVKLTRSDTRFELAVIDVDNIE